MDGRPLYRHDELVSAGVRVGLLVEFLVVEFHFMFAVYSQLFLSWLLLVFTTVMTLHIMKACKCLFTTPMSIA